MDQYDGRQCWRDLRSHHEFPRRPVTHEPNLHRNENALPVKSSSESVGWLRQPLVIAAILTAMTVVMTIGRWPANTVELSDGPYYIPIAEGRMDQAIKPFANRVLH